MAIKLFQTMWTDLKDCDLFLPLFISPHSTLCVSFSLFVPPVCSMLGELQRTYAATQLYEIHDDKCFVCYSYVAYDLLCLKYCISSNFETQIRTQSINQKQ